MKTARRRRNEAMPLKRQIGSGEVAPAASSSNGSRYANTRNGTTCEAKRVVLYLRVSTDRQAKQNTSIPAQRKELDAEVHRRRWIKVDEYVDEGESGTTDNRPRFQEMLADARKRPRPFDAILVYDFSRFARDRVDSAVHKRSHRKLGISVQSLSQQIEDTAEGKLLEGVVESVDQYYADRLRIVSARGQRELARRGFWRGGPRPYGYCLKKVDDGANERSRLEIDPECAPFVREAFERAADGESIRGITFWLNASEAIPPRGSRWNVSTVYQMLRRKVYMGTVEIKGKITGVEPTIVEDGCPAIVARSLWAAVQLQLQRRRIHNQNTERHVYLLNGIARCSECGTPLTVMATGPKRSRPRRWRYYVCRGRREGNGCKAPNIRIERLEANVLNRFLWLKLNDATSRLVGIESSDIARERKKVARLDEQTEHISDAIANGDLQGMPSVRAKIFERAQKLEIERAAVRKRLANLELAQKAEPLEGSDELTGFASGDKVPEGLDQRRLLKRFLRRRFTEIAVDLAEGLATRVYQRHPLRIEADVPRVAEDDVRELNRIAAENGGCVSLTSVRRKAGRHSADLAIAGVDDGGVVLLVGRLSPRPAAIGSDPARRTQLLSEE